MYPKWKYHPEKEALIVHSLEAETALGDGWYESPADYGVETCPAPSGPDPVIADKRAKYLASQAAVVVTIKPKSQKPVKEMKS